jgi:hypothetical protein
MVTAGIASHPAAGFCVGLTIGGYNDWYLPARYELDIAYANLKPTTANNDPSFGINPYSVPERTVNYTTGNPARTSISAFQDGGAEAFVAGQHLSSTEVDANFPWYVFFTSGIQLGNFSGKTSINPLRAFRKVAL